MNFTKRRSARAPIKLLCPSCRCDTLHETLFIKNGSTIRRCGRCGLGRAEFDDFQPEKYYSDDYFNGGRVDGYVDYAGSESVLRAEFARMVKMLAHHCSRCSRLLEIGCAHGFFLQEAQKSFEVHGIELSQGAVDACHRAGLKNVRQGVADDDNLARIGGVDAIVLLDVIEHLPEPVETLCRLSSRLNPGGVIVITTGDYGSPVARLTGRRWRLMTPPQHMWFFSRTSIAGIAGFLGLNMVSHDRPWKVVPVSLILFQIARMFGLNIKASSLAYLSKLGIPVNLFDSMRIILRKPPSQE